MLLLNDRICAVFINQSGDQSAELAVSWRRIARFHLECDSGTSAFEVDVQAPFLLPVFEAASWNIDAGCAHINESATGGLIISAIHNGQHEALIFIDCA